MHVVDQMGVHRVGQPVLFETELLHRAVETPVAAT
jgi:hypothetical protein